MNTNSNSRAVYWRFSSLFLISIRYVHDNLPRSILYSISPTQSHPSTRYEHGLQIGGYNRRAFCQRAFRTTENRIPIKCRLPGEAETLMTMPGKMSCRKDERDMPNLKEVSGFVSACSYSSFVVRCPSAHLFRTACVLVEVSFVYRKITESSRSTSLSVRDGVDTKSNGRPWAWRKACS